VNLASSHWTGAQIECNCKRDSQTNVGAPNGCDHNLWEAAGPALRGGNDIARVSVREVTTKDLKVLSDLIESGKVCSVIDRRYAFAEIPAAIAYLENGHARGKLVAQVA
jgi:NADPH:quinone reductase-like Zn-dependent oxidoreductase